MLTSSLKGLDPRNQVLDIPSHSFRKIHTGDVQISQQIAKLHYENYHVCLGPWVDSNLHLSVSEPTYSCQATRPSRVLTRCRASREAHS